MDYEIEDLSLTLYLDKSPLMTLLSDYFHKSTKGDYLPVFLPELDNKLNSLVTGMSSSEICYLLGYIKNWLLKNFRSFKRDSEGFIKIPINNLDFSVRWDNFTPFN